MLNEKKAFVGNAADENQVRDAEKKSKYGRERDLEDMKFILSTSQGRRMLWRYLEHCGIYKDSFTGNSATFYNEGRRAVGIKLLDDITAADPDTYLTMMKENKV